MDNFQFEGDFETLSDPQLNLVKNVLQKRGFNGGKVVVEPVGQKGDNYVANVKRFIYTKSDGSAFKMIGKVAPAIEVIRKMMKTMVLFNNEIEMYEKVIPKLNAIQRSSSAPADERIRFPECYGILNEAPNEMILLEDLGEEDFKMLDRFQPLQNDSVRLVLKDLAIFHSLSFVLKNIDSEAYKNSASKLINIWGLGHEDVRAQKVFEAIENDMKALVDNEEHKRVITGTLSQLDKTVKKHQDYEKTSKYNVILQGDCWVNNILFRVDDGKSVANIMIDYQISRESNPAVDLLYFIFNCTDHESRVNNFHEWINYYHEMLGDALANHGLKSDRIFPKDQLDADLKRYGKMIVGFVLILSSMTVRESKDAVDFQSMEGANRDDMFDTGMTQLRVGALDDSTISLLKRRITGIVESAVQLEIV